MNARAPVIVLFHSPVVGEQAHKIRVFAQRWAQQGAEYGVNITSTSRPSSDCWEEFWYVALINSVDSENLSRSIA